jgi:hypothetical protein
MYKVPDQQRYEEFLRQAPEKLAAEAALLRLLIENAVRDGRVALANTLLATLARISTAHQAAQVRAGQLLERDRVLKIGVALCGLLADALRDRGIANWEMVVDEVRERVPELFEETTNEKPLLLPAPDIS